MTKQKQLSQLPRMTSFRDRLQASSRLPSSPSLSLSHRTVQGCRGPDAYADRVSHIISWSRVKGYRARRSSRSARLLRPRHFNTGSSTNISQSEGIPGPTLLTECKVAEIQTLSNHTGLAIPCGVDNNILEQSEGIPGPTLLTECKVAETQTL